MSEKKITPQEAEALTKKLYMKYKAEVEAINVMIQKDIDLYKHVTLETNAAKEALSARILKEKERL
jgi:hypothetical protein